MKDPLKDEENTISITQDNDDGNDMALGVRGILKKQIRNRTLEENDQLWKFFRKAKFFVNLKSTIGEKYASKCAEKLTLLRLKQDELWPKADSYQKQGGRDEKGSKLLRQKHQLQQYKNSNQKSTEQKAESNRYDPLKNIKINNIGDIYKDKTRSQAGEQRNSSQYLTFKNENTYQAILLFSGNVAVKKQEEQEQIKAGDNIKDVYKIQLLTNCEFVLLTIDAFTKVLEERVRDRNLEMVELIQKSGLFNDCARESLLNLVSKKDCHTKHFLYNQIVYDQSAEVDGIYFIITGTFSISQITNTQGNEKTIRVAELTQEGCSFGQEEIFLNQNYRKNRVMASSNQSVALFFNLKDCLTLLQGIEFNKIAAAQIENRDNVVQCREQLEQSQFSSFLFSNKKRDNSQPEQYYNAKDMSFPNNCSPSILSATNQKKLDKSEFQARTNLLKKQLEQRKLPMNFLTTIESQQSTDEGYKTTKHKEQVKSIRIMHYPSKSPIKKDKSQNNSIEGCHINMENESISLNKAIYSYVTPEKNYGMKDSLLLERKCVLDNFQQIISQNANLQWKGGISDNSYHAKFSRLQAAGGGVTIDSLKSLPRSNRKYSILNKEISFTQQDKTTDHQDSNNKTLDDSRTQSMLKNYSISTSIVPCMNQQNVPLFENKALSPILSQDCQKGQKSSSKKQKTHRYNQSLQDKDIENIFDLTNKTIDLIDQQKSTQIKSFSKSKDKSHSLQPKTIENQSIQNCIQSNQESSDCSIPYSVDFLSPHMDIIITQESKNQSPFHLPVLNGKNKKVEYFFSQRFPRYKPQTLSTSRFSLSPVKLPDISPTSACSVSAFQNEPNKYKDKKTQNSSSQYREEDLHQDSLHIRNSFSPKHRVQRIESMEFLTKGIPNKQLQKYLLKSIKAKNSTEPTDRFSIQRSDSLPMDVNHSPTLPTLPCSNIAKPKSMNKQFLRKARKQFKEKLQTAHFERKWDQAKSLLNAWEIIQSDKMTDNLLLENKDLLSSLACDEFCKLKNTLSQKCISQMQIEPNQDISASSEKCKKLNDQPKQLSQKEKIQSIEKEGEVRQSQGKNEKIFLKQLIKSKNPMIMHKISLQLLSENEFFDSKNI